MRAIQRSIYKDYEIARLKALLNMDGTNHRRSRRKRRNRFK